MDLLGEDKVSEIDRWFSGAWQPFVVKQLDDGAKQYGENFPLSTQEGYFIRANQEFNWSN